MKKEIAKLLAGSSALPVLFIGSGLTRRYLDLPNWEGLLRKFCVKPFEYYYGKAERACRDQLDMLYPTLADYIEEDFNEVWYTDSNYKQSRELHTEDLKQKISPFKFCIADFIRDSSANIQEMYAEEISKFKAIRSKISRKTDNICGGIVSAIPILGVFSNQFRTVWKMINLNN